MSEDAAAADSGDEDAVMAGVAAGNINLSGGEVLSLSSSSLEGKRQQEEVARQVRARRRARQIVVPTQDARVKARLRAEGEPICLFGEREPERRERLRGVLALAAVDREIKAERGEAGGEDGDEAAAAAAAAEEDAAAAAREGALQDKEYVTAGPPGLREARLALLRESKARAAARLAAARAREAVLAEGGPTAEAEEDRRFAEECARTRRLSPLSSQVGDERPVAAVAFEPSSARVATGSWTGDCRLWSVPACAHEATLRGHTGRVTDVAFRPGAGVSLDAAAAALLSASVDGTAMLWALPAGGGLVAEEEEEEDGNNDGDDGDKKEKKKKKKRERPVVRPLGVLRGHADRLTRATFLPGGRHAVTGSFDRTWRLWDVETRQCLAVQTGHGEPVYALAAHPDGSLVLSGDLGGVTHVWDVRTGRQALQLRGHVQQVLCADFCADGFRVATGSGDSTARVWDLRRRRLAHTVLAHTGLVPTVRFEPRRGDYLLTAGFDGAVRSWSGRDFCPVAAVAAHDAKVLRADLSPCGGLLATCSHDRNWKLWEVPPPTAAAQSSSSSSSSSSA